MFSKNDVAWLTAASIARLSTDDLHAITEMVGIPDQVWQWAEQEIDRRDYDASDPWSPQNHHDDDSGLDDPWWRSS
jgi:hypothetical protein